MEIKGSVYCFFEQSGTFKNEFIKLGVPAEDYDIKNEYGQTDHVMDLFAEIEAGFDGRPSVFDGMTPDDLIIAFFPCIYFTGWTNPLYYRLENVNYRGLTLEQKLDTILERSRNRQRFYELLYKMIGTCLKRGLRIIFENPYSTQHYLHDNFLQPPSVIDGNRALRGDYFKKPTGYWYFNCEPTHTGMSLQENKNLKTIVNCAGAASGGICSRERSEISPNYARNFICDFILGIKQTHTLGTLF